MPAGHLHCLERELLASQFEGIPAVNPFNARKFEASGVDPAQVLDVDDLARLPVNEKSEPVASQAVAPCSVSTSRYSPNRLFSWPAPAGQPPSCCAWRSRARTSTSTTSRAPRPCGLSAAPGPEISVSTASFTACIAGCQRSRVVEPDGHAFADQPVWVGGHGTIDPGTGEFEMRYLEKVIADIHSGKFAPDMVQ